MVRIGTSFCLFSLVSWLMAFFGLQFSLRAKILLHANWKPMQFVEFHLKIQEHRKWSEGNLSLHIFKWQNAEINLKKPPLISYARGSYFFLLVVTCQKSKTLWTKEMKPSSYLFNCHYSFSLQVNLSWYCKHSFRIEIKNRSFREAWR